MRIAAAILTLLLAAAPALGAVPIDGRWLVEDGTAVIAVGRCGASTCGHIERFVRVDPSRPHTDINNPDPALRDRPFLGLAVLSGFADAGDAWRGRIYDPKSGRTYKSIVRRQPDGSLKVQGCIAFICQTQHWVPVK
ncbi:DUF2147 domain-containing protein [Sphingomonas bacterium]|uniref:DUF2147 domain-containing protein n=1 Tax=Sphingomonas bacterium TaxID=1895847 RepID=UPI001575A57F|nr:DUF2147 domain-containing protein [Sphingomonas bacterium]